MGPASSFFDSDWALSWSASGWMVLDLIGVALFELRCNSFWKLSMLEVSWWSSLA